MSPAKDLSERDVCTKSITPALVAAGWDVQNQICEEVGFTKGRIIVRGRLVTRGKDQRNAINEHLQPFVDWWGGADRSGRVQTECAWKVDIDTIKSRGYNLDIKSPHTVAADHGDPETLLAGLVAAEQHADTLRDRLKAILSDALLR